MNRLSTLQNHLRPTEQQQQEEEGLVLNNVLSSDDNSIGAKVKDLYDTFVGNVEFSSKKHGGVLAAEVLKAHGVKFIFTLSGGHISPILCSSEDIGIKIIDVRHEVSSVFCADAVGRLTGFPGIAAVTAGPGVTNTITALKNAQLAESPLILLAGAAATLTKGRGALQDVDQMSIVQSICKYSVSVTSTRDIIPCLKRAFRESVSGTPGPCFVELPLDVLYPVTEAMGGMGLSVRKYKKDLKKEEEKLIMLPSEFKNIQEYLKQLEPNEAVFLHPSQTQQPYVINKYMEFKVKSIFAGGFNYRKEDLLPLQISIPTPSKLDVQKVIELLKKCQRPVLIIGSQAISCGTKDINNLVSSVKQLNIPTFLGGMARGLLGKDGKNHVRQNRGMALKKSDLIILAGSICDFRLGYGRELPKKPSSIISINRSKEKGMINAGIFWNPTLFCECDAGLFLIEILKTCKAEEIFKENSQQISNWLKELKVAEKKKEDGNLQKSKEIALGRIEKWPNGPTKPDEKAKQLLNPIAVLQALDDCLPDNSILVVDGGDFVATASYTVRPRGALCWVDPGAFGTLGVAPAALACKVLNPDKFVVIIYGDGASAYSLAEIDTMTRHGLPCVVLIGNDACWTQIEREQKPMFNSDAACALSYCDYEQVAKGYGGNGVKMELGDDLHAIFKRAFQEVKTSKRPFLINAIIGRTNFREGSISV